MPDRPAAAPTTPVPNYGKAQDHLTGALSFLAEAVGRRRIGSHDAAEEWDGCARHEIREALRELDAGQHPAVQADRALNLGLPL